MDSRQREYTPDGLRSNHSSAVGAPHASPARKRWALNARAGSARPIPLLPDDLQQWYPLPVRRKEEVQTSQE